MSTDYIEYEQGIASNCCASSILANTDICSECGEHCAPVLWEDLEYDDLMDVYRDVGMSPSDFI